MQKANSGGIRQSSRRRGSGKKGRDVQKEMAWVLAELLLPLVTTLVVTYVNTL